MNHADEILSILREEIEQYDSRTRQAETGTVLEIGDGIATVYGLDRAVYGELIEFDTGAQGMVLNLERDSVGIVLLGSPAGLCLPRREKIRIASSMATRSTAVTRMAISTRLPFFRRAT